MRVPLAHSLSLEFSVAGVKNDVDSEIDSELDPGLLKNVIGRLCGLRDYQSDRKSVKTDFMESMTTSEVLTDILQASSGLLLWETLKWGQWKHFSRGGAGSGVGLRPGAAGCGGSTSEPIESTTVLLLQHVLRIRGALGSSKKIKTMGALSVKSDKKAYKNVTHRV